MVLIATLLRTGPIGRLCSQSWWRCLATCTKLSTHIQKLQVWVVPLPHLALVSLSSVPIRGVASSSALYHERGLLVHPRQQESLCGRSARGSNFVQNSSDLMRRPQTHAFERRHPSPGLVSGTRTIIIQSHPRIQWITELAA